MIKTNGWSYNEFRYEALTIKLLQDSLKEDQTLEDVLQDNLLLVSAHRKMVKSDKAGNRTKSILSQMGRLM